jgi:hypothetical protein
MSYKVFISYSTKNINEVNHIKKMLAHSSIDVFVAEYSLLPGQPLSETIINAINNCDLFLLLWSNSAKESEWVPQEIGVARSINKTILPVILEQNLSLPGFISNLKYLNGYKNPEKALECLQTNVFKNAEQKQKNEGLIWLGLGAAILWLTSK